MTSEQNEIVLTQIQRKGRLFLLLFSNDFQVKATKGVIDKYNLTEGLVFSAELFGETKNLLEEKYAIYTAESVLARRAFSIGEFKNRLRRKEVSDPFIKKMVQVYKAKGLLDDYKYAISRAQSVLNRKPAGRSFLIANVQSRLVPREIAEKAVKELLADVDEIEMATELLTKKRASLTKFDLETARRKAYNYLSRRAISYRAAKEAFEKLFKQSEP